MQITERDKFLNESKACVVKMEEERNHFFYIEFTFQYNS